MTLGPGVQSATLSLGYSIDSGGARCDWCRADYYRPTRETCDPQSAAYRILRCPRCGQPDRTCNEIAGRPFRMTWDHRSPWFTIWADEGEFPRMPASRCELAQRLIARSEAINVIEPEDLVELLMRATCIPRTILFGEAPSGFGSQMAPAGDQ